MSEQQLIVYVGLDAIRPIAAHALRQGRQELAATILNFDSERPLTKWSPRGFPRRTRSELIYSWIDSHTDIPWDLTGIGRIADFFHADPNTAVSLVTDSDAAHRFAMEAAAALLASVGFTPNHTSLLQPGSPVAPQLYALISRSHVTLHLSAAPEVTIRELSTLREALAAEVTVHPDLAPTGTEPTLPHYVKMVRAGRLESPGDPALAPMTARTSHWVNTDVWEYDLLQQINLHDGVHGQNVDRLSAELLSLVPSFHKLCPTDQKTVSEILSAAAWLHDVGQRGGPLGPAGQWVTDPEHVRKYHGLLTHGLLQSYHGDFNLDDLQFSLVGLLCKAHQRCFKIAARDTAVFKPCARTVAKRDCDICTAAVDELRSSLESEMQAAAQKQANAAPTPSWMETLACILRLSDAADIGVHRIRSRWNSSAGQSASVEGWQRQCALQLAHSLPPRSEDRQRIERVLAGHRLQDTDIKTIADALSGHEQAIDFGEYLGFLADQASHVEKQRAFTGAHISGAALGTCEVRLTPADSSGFDSNLDSSTRAAARYIFGEYGDMQDHFPIDGELPVLTAVTAGDVTVTYLEWSKKKLAGEW